MKKLLVSLILALPIIAIVMFNLTISVASDTVSIPVEKIEFQTETHVTNIGQTYSLDTIIYPSNASNKVLIWESSDEEVVTVSPDGQVSFIGFGSAYVTATSLDGNKQTSCYFFVTDTVVHRVLLYTLDDVRQVNVGETLQIYAEVLPKEAVNKQIYFASTNEEVATVNSQGLVSAKSIGTTSIIATSEDGGHIANMQITVYQAASQILLEEYVLTQQSYHQIDVMLEPFDADRSKIVYELDSEIASVDSSGKVVFESPGIVDVKVSFENISKSVEIEYTNGYASSLSVPYTTKYADYSENTIQLEYTVVPSNLYNTEVLFSSSNTEVAQVNSQGLISIEGGGVTIITLQVEKSDLSIIEKRITLFVTRQAEEIIAQSFVTANAVNAVEYSTLPNDNTNLIYFFETQSQIASVDNQGIVTFTQAGVAEITIFANATKNISKTININYTGGYAVDFEIESSLYLNSNQSALIMPAFYPANTSIKNINYQIVSQASNDGKTDGVVSLLPNGGVKGLLGGSARISATLDVGQGLEVVKYIDVFVNKNAEEIQLLTNLELLNGEYITGTQNVEINALVLPADTSNKTVTYQVSAPEAVTITANTILFKYPTSITLTATDISGNVTGQAKIRYTNTILSAVFESFSQSINVGQTTSINLDSYTPSNLTPEITLQITNQATKANGQVVSIVNNQITGVNGGQATIAVYVAGIYRRSFEIEVIRLSESLEVYPKNIQTTSRAITLNYMINPIDTTQNQIIWQLDNNQIAEINDGVLTFTGEGIVTITATVNDSNSASTTFTVEKVLEDVSNISPSEENQQLYVGEFVQIQSSAFCSVYEITSQSSENVISVSETGFISALNVGQATVTLTEKDEYGVIINIGEINISVLNYVSEIVLISNDLDWINGEYVTAKEKNQLGFELFPTEYVNQNVTFELVNSNNATINGDELTFYSEGRVSLKATSQDGGCIRIWTVKYTGGYAVDFEINVEENINLEKDEQVTFAIQSIVPSNTQGVSLNIQSLSQNAMDYIEIDGLTLTAKAGGSVQILAKIGTSLTKTITINITENISQISFRNHEVLTTNSSYTFTPTILPQTATDRSVVYSVNNPEIASIENGVITFTTPGSVVVTVTSANDESIFDTMTINSTMGYPTSITLNSNNYNLTVGESAIAFVSAYSPATANEFELTYEIIENQPLEQNEQVLSVDDKGKIVALSPGSAKIRVSIVNEYGIDVFSIVDVEVTPQFNAIDIAFAEELDLVNGVYITGTTQLEFNVLLLPSGSQTNYYTLTISDEDIVGVDENLLIFENAGVVKITVTSTYNTSVNKTITINYTAGAYTYVDVDESGFTPVGSVKQKNVYTGQTFKFEILEKIPSNITNSIINITVVSTTSNVAGLAVGKVEGEQVVFYNGGSIEVNLTINGYNLGNFTFEVVRVATLITVLNEEVYVAVPTYQIDATVHPSDTTDKTLAYQSSNTEIAQVYSNGLIEFLQVGRVEIQITNTASEVTKTISVTYTRQLESITFAEVSTTLSVGSTVLLETSVFPLGIDDYEIVFTTSDISIATVSAEGRVITYNKEGKVTIVAYIEGNSDISVSIEFTVINYITNIALELDRVYDNLGIANKRVFGNEFVSTQTESGYDSTYQMNVASIIPSTSTDTLTWSSSNRNIAMVDENGLVTFTGVGNVTIRVQPTNQYNPARPVYDEYEFEILTAVNVYSFEEFIVAIRAEKNIVLQADAIISKDVVDRHSVTSAIVFKTDIYGNGHMLSLARFIPSEYKMILQGEGVVIDNITIRSENLGEENTLQDLAMKSVLLKIDNATNVVIKNTILENAYVLAKTFGSKALFSGVIFKNAGFGHVVMAHSLNAQVYNISTFKNCVFQDALIGAILFDYDNSTSTKYASKVIIQEHLYMYNFQKPNEVLGEGTLSRVPEVVRGLISSNVDAFLSVLEPVAHTYKGETYYHLGILAVDVDYYIDTNKSPGIVDVTQMYDTPYRFYEMHENVVGIKADVRVWTIMPGADTNITPDTVYDSTIYDIIRDES